MDEKDDDDDVVIAESADADINVDVYGSAVELENDFFAALGVKRGYKCRKHFHSGNAVYSTELSEIRALSHKANRRIASDLSMSTPTRSRTPSSVDSSDVPSAKRRAYDIVVTCQHVEPLRDNLSCMIEAIKGLVETLRQIGDEEAMQEIPGLLKQLRDLQKKKIKKLQSSGNY